MQHPEPQPSAAAVRHLPSPATNTSFTINTVTWDAKKSSANGCVSTATHVGLPVATVLRLSHHVLVISHVVGTAARLESDAMFLRQMPEKGGSPMSQDL